MLYYDSFFNLHYWSSRIFSYSLRHLFLSHSLSLSLSLLLSYPFVLFLVFMYYLFFVHTPCMYILLINIHIAQDLPWETNKTLVLTSSYCFIYYRFPKMRPYMTRVVNGDNFIYIVRKYKYTQISDTFVYCFHTKVNFI